MDCFHYTPARALWPALVMLSLASPAMAGAITNLSDMRHVVEIQTSKGYSPQEILPGETFRIIGKVRIKFEQKEIWLDDDMEFAIWQDGSFGPQRRINRRKR